MDVPVSYDRLSESGWKSWEKTLTKEERFVAMLIAKAGFFAEVPPLYGPAFAARTEKRPGHSGRDDSVWKVWRRESALASA
jgi:hypothetical protein